MANYNYNDNNFGGTIVLNAVNQDSDTYQFDGERPFTIIFDAGSGIAGNVSLQMKIGTSNYYTIYTFNSTTVIKQAASYTNNTFWKFKTSSNFSGTATIIVAQSIIK